MANEQSTQGTKGSWRDMLDPEEAAGRFTSDPNFDRKGQPIYGVSPLEIAVALQKFKARLGMANAARKFKRSQSWADGYLRLFELERESQELFGPAHKAKKRLKISDLPCILQQAPGSGRTEMAKNISAQRAAATSKRRVWTNRPMESIDPC